MNGGSTIGRAARILGLGLLSVACFSYNSGQPADVRLFAGFGITFGLWCLLEIVLTYFQRSS